MRGTGLVLLVLTLAACSDDGGEQADSLEERRAAYVESAEQVCADANDEVEALPAPTSVDGVGPYAEQLVGVLVQTVEQVTALEPPEEDRAELTEKVIDPLEADVDRARAYAEQVSAAAAAGDSPTLLRLVSEVPQTSADLSFLREYGLVECAEAADTST